MKAERQAVYDALDALPDVLFAAYVASLVGLNRVMAVTVLDDPTTAAALDVAIKPWAEKIGAMA